VGGRVILLRRLLIVIVITVIAAGLAYGFSHKQETRKVATASLVFGQPRPDLQVVAGNFSTGDQSSQMVPATNASLVSSDDVARATAAKLGMNVTDVRNDVSVSSQQSSEIVNVKASRASGAQAAQLANTYANVFVDRAQTEQRRRANVVRDALQKQLEAARSSTTTQNALGSSSSAAVESLRSQIAAESAIAKAGTGSPSISQTASATSTSTSPQTSRNVVFGALFGLVLGIGIASLAAGSRRERPYDDDHDHVHHNGGQRQRDPVGV
jgi:capsular polysaccharide biosynthesis protein